MSLEVTGKLLVKNDTQQVSERFKKREFVLELTDDVNGNVYTNYAKMQLVQNKCEILDQYNEGDMLKVSFNIKGNKWERDGKVNYITNLDAWRIEGASEGGQPTAMPQQSYSQQPSNNNGGGSDFGGYNPSPENVDDLPF